MKIDLVFKLYELWRMADKVTKFNDAAEVILNDRITNKYEKLFIEEKLQEFKDDIEKAYEFCDIWDYIDFMMTKSGEFKFTNDKKISKSKIIKCIEEYKYSIINAYGATLSVRNFIYFFLDNPELAIRRK